MNKIEENRITFRNVNRKLITFTVFSMIQEPCIHLFLIDCFVNY